MEKYKTMPFAAHTYKIPEEVLKTVKIKNCNMLANSYAGCRRLLTVNLCM